MARWWCTLVYGVGLLSACRFSAQLPAETVITCTSQAECPSGFRCVTRVQRCFSNESDDREAPRLVGALPTHPLRPGANETFTLTSSEPLAAVDVTASPAESLTLSSPDLERVVQGTPVTLQVGAAAADGPVRVLGAAVDRAGNLLSDAELGTVVIDGTAPAVTGVSAPAATRPGAPFVVQIAFSEPVAPGVVLSLTHDLTHLDSQPSTGAGPLLTVTLTFPPGTPDGSYLLSLSQVSDLAGNQMPPLSVSQTVQVQVDGTRPLVQQPTLSRSRFSQVAGFDRLEVPVTVSEPAAITSVCLLSDCRTAQSGDRVVFNVTPAVPEGPAFVTLTAVDAVGNTSDQVTVPVTFDYTAPEVVPGTVTLQLTPPLGCPLQSVSALGPGSTAGLSLTLNERPVRAPTVELMQPMQRTATLETGAATSWSYRLTLPSTLTANGAASWRVSTEDDVGNASVATLPVAAVALDAEAPVLPADLPPGAVTYRRAPWGSADGPVAFSLEVDGGVLEPNTTLRVLSSDTAGALEFGRTTTTSAAAFSLPLSNSDRPTVYVVSVDPACNASPVREVKDIEWVATSNGKRVGSSLENPHTFETFAAFGASRTGGTEVSGESVAQSDGRSLTVETSRRDWVRRRFAPPGRAGAAMAFDAERQRLVEVSLAPAEVWEFDGDVWELRAPEGGVSLPTAGNLQLVFDTRRHRIIAAGFVDALSGQAINQFYEWDGTRWSTPGPMSDGPFTDGPRANFLIAYDTDLQRLLLFGGTTLGVAHTDLWSWNGAVWASLPTLTEPVTTFALVGMTYDPVHHGLVVFENRPRMRALFFDGTAWSLDDSPSAPFQRFTYALPRLPVVFDATLGSAVFFGPRQFSNLTTEAWAWSGPGQWSQLAASAAVAPAGRTLATAAYDPPRQRTVLFGGALQNDYQFTVYDELWSLTASGWSLASEGVPLTAPAGTGGITHVFDDARHVWVTVATSLSADPLVYEWDLRRRVQVTPGTTASPPPRQGFGAATYDPENHRVLLFGGRQCAHFYAPGLCDTFSYANDLWSWNGAVFTNLTPTSGPLPTGRYFAQLTWDHGRHRAVLTNGATVNDVLVPDVWAFDGTQWVSLGASPTPHGAALTFDPDRNRIVAFGGGTDVYLSSGATSHDLWELDGTQWALQTPVGATPPDTIGASATYVTATKRAFFFGGSSPGASYSTASWEWDGANRAWSPVLTRSAPTDRFSPVAYDSRRERVMLGTSWELGLHAAERPGFTGRFSMAAAQAGASRSVQLTVKALVGASGTSPGVDLSVFESGAYLGRAQSQATAATPAPLRWQTTDEAEINRLIGGPQRELGVALAARGFSGGTPVVRAATLTVDAIEVTWSYRRP